MARPITYDRDEVIAQSTELFWEHGFDEVSIKDIVQSTGMNRHSLYRLFGSKEGLFSAVLDHYADRSRGGVLAALHDASEGWATVERFFAEMGAVIAHGPPRMCLMARTLVAPFPDDDERVLKALEHFDWIEGQLRAALEVAAARGQLAEHVDPAGAARMLTLLLQGTTLSRRRVGESTHLDVAFAAAARGLRA